LQTKENMPTFTPPVVQYPNDSGDWLMDMLLQNHGQTIYSLDGGATFVNGGEYPYVGDLASIDPITSQVTGPSTNAQEGVTYFLGGRIYNISQAIADVLIASGFGANVVGTAVDYSADYEAAYH